MIIFCSILLRMRNVSDIVQKTKTHIRGSISFFFRKSCLYNVEKYFRAGQATGYSMRLSILRCIPKATNTHSEYVMLAAFSTATMVVKKASHCCVIRTLSVLLDENCSTTTCSNKVLLLLHRTTDKPFILLLSLDLLYLKTLKLKHKILFFSKILRLGNRR